MKNFKDLVVWEKAHALTLASYRVTAAFPAEERFLLVSQIRRAASSIAANIAEGCGRKENAEFHRFLQMAMGSASELEYHFLLARDLGYIADEPYKSLEAEVLEVKRMLSALIRKVAAERSASAYAGK